MLMVSLLQSLIVHAAAPAMTVIDGVGAISADPNALVNKFVVVGLSIGTAVAVILVAVGGYKMMSSHGDVRQIQDAQDQIQNAILGFLLILGAAAVVYIIVNAIGVGNIVNIN